MEIRIVNKHMKKFSKVSISTIEIRRSFIHNENLASNENLAYSRILHKKVVIVFNDFVGFKDTHMQSHMAVYSKVDLPDTICIKCEGLQIITSC